MSVPSLQSVLNAAQSAPRWELEYHGLHLTASESDDAGTLARLLDHLIPILDRVASHASTARSGSGAVPTRADEPQAPARRPLDEVPTLPADAPGAGTVALPDLAKAISLPPEASAPVEPAASAGTVGPGKAVAVLVPSTQASVPSSGKGALPHDLRGLADIHLMQYDRDDSADTTGQEARLCLDIFISINGNKTANQVNVLDMEHFLSALSAWPKHRQFIEGYKTMTPAELVDHARKEKLPVISANTQEKYVRKLSAFFNRVKEWGRCDKNPVLFINRRKHFGDPVCHSKRSYINPEFQRVFNKEEMAAADAPWKFFGHLIPGFVGSRSNEIGQLKRADIYVERIPDRDGVIHEVLCLHLGLGRKKKNKNAVRTIPVPRQVLALGFEDYLADLDACGEPDLFPGLRASNGRPGATIENWFNTMLRTEWEILDKRLTFHCFRHTVVTLMRNARTPPSIRRALLGQSGKQKPGTLPTGDSVSENHYEDEVTPLDMLNELDRLPFPDIDVEPYKRGRFDHYLKAEGVRRRSNEKLIKAGKPPLSKRGPAAGFGKINSTKKAGTASSNKTSSKAQGESSGPPSTA